MSRFASLQSAAQAVKPSANLQSFHNGHRIPNFPEQKRAVLDSRQLSNSLILNLNSVNRDAGSIAQPIFILGTPLRDAYAMSLKSAEIPISWGNILVPISFTVTYQNVSSFPLDITIPAGNWTYDPEAGQITFTQANAAPVTSYTDNIIYYILRNFGGALDSIEVNASTGVWIWVWDASVGTVTSTDPSVSGFFKIIDQTLSNWISSGPPDLSGVKLVTFSCAEFANQSCITSSTTNQTYFCSAAVNASYGETLIHEPVIEQITFLQHGLTLSQFTISIIDPTTNLVLPLQADFCMEIKIYTGAPQGL